MMKMGNDYWKVNSEGDSCSYLTYIIPSIEDLYSAKYANSNNVEYDSDSNVRKFKETRDIRMLVKGLGNGSLLSFQVLYSSEIIKDSVAAYCIGYGRNYKRELLEELRANLTRAVYGELNSNIEKLKKVNNNKTKNRIYGAIFRLHYILKCLMDGGNPFIKWFDDENAINKCRSIISGEEVLTKEEFSSIIKYKGRLKLPYKVFPANCDNLNNLKDYVKDYIFD